MEIRELRAFVAVVDEGGLSAAARRLHLSQSALSQTVRSLERQLGRQLLVRDHAGAHPTEAGQALAHEARGLIVHYDEMLATVAVSETAASRRIKIGVPLEFPVDLLPDALTRLALEHPQTKIELQHASSAAQLSALRANQLDVALVRDRPADGRLDAVLAVEEPMGVLLTASRSAELAEPTGVALSRLAGLDWVAFGRAESPAWYDQVAAILRGHGLTVPDQTSAGERSVIAEVKLAAAGTGRAFALASAGWGQPLPDGIRWHPLVGRPIVRRTWAVWHASARGSDLAAFIELLDLSSAGG